MQARGQVLITAAELAGMIQAGDPVSILDVRWRLDEPDGHAAYLQGHLPGAVFVSLEDELSDHTIAGRGRHPLPSGASLQATVAGIANVRILDGGLPAWRSAGGSIETGQVSPQLGNVTVLHDDLYAGQRLTLTAQQAGAGGVTLLDARVPERFRGDVEPVDAVAGHIPGAINVPSGSVLADDGTFLGNGALNALLSDHGIDHGGRVGVYCGSGVSAAVIVAALAVIGQDAELFPGSWSEWSSDPTRPVGRGTA